MRGRRRDLQGVEISSIFEVLKLFKILLERIGKWNVQFSQLNYHPLKCLSSFFSISTLFSSSIVLYWKIISNGCKLRPTYTHTYCFHPHFSLDCSFKTHLLHFFLFFFSCWCSFSREIYVFWARKRQQTPENIARYINFSAWQVSECEREKTLCCSWEWVREKSN